MDDDLLAGETVINTGGNDENDGDETEDDKKQEDERVRIILKQTFSYNTN